MYKKNVMKKVTSAALAGAMGSALLLTGIGGPEQVSAADLEPVELKIMMAGDQEPADQQKVLDKISEVTKDELNITLDVTYVPWADYLDKVKMMAAAGDEFDIFLNFGSDANSLYNKKMAMPLTDLLNEYGQDILADIPEEEWYPFTVNDEITAIPAMYLKDGIYETGLLRKDLREKYNLPEVTDKESLETYLATIKENEPTMVPIGGFMGLRGGIQRYAGPMTEYIKRDLGVAEWARDEDGKIKVYNTFEKGKSRYQLTQTIREYYENGWFEKDVLNQDDPTSLFVSGKAAYIEMDLFNFNTIETRLKAAIPEAEMEWVFFKPEDKVLWEQSNNLAQISTTSKNPERAMMFMNWLHEDQANYDLYMYGIEGEHYTLENDLIKLPEGIDASNNPYAPTPWAFYNEKFHRGYTTDSEATLSAREFFKNVEKVPVDKEVALFTPNQDNIALELGQISKVLTEEWEPIALGVRDIDECYDEFIKDLEDAGMQTVLDEVQRQIDEAYGQ